MPLRLTISLGRFCWWTRSHLLMRHEGWSMPVHQDARAWVGIESRIRRSPPLHHIKTIGTDSEVPALTFVKAKTAFKLVALGPTFASCGLISSYNNCIIPMTPQIRLMALGKKKKESDRSPNLNPNTLVTSARIHQQNGT